MFENLIIFGNKYIFYGKGNFLESLTFLSADFSGICYLDLDFATGVLKRKTTFERWILRNKENHL